MTHDAVRFEEQLRHTSDELWLRQRKLSKPPSSSSSVFDPSPGGGRGFVVALLSHLQESKVGS